MYRIACACVKVVCIAFGAAFGFSQTRLFRILNPSCCSANPRLKIMWCVPVTHSVPSGLRMRRASPSHSRLNSWSLRRPMDLSQRPLSTGANSPFLIVTPPLESR